MKSKFTAILLAAGLTLSAGSAQAQGFEGAYAAGYFSLPLNPGTTNWLVGAQAGYNFSVGGDVYVGVEADAAWVNNGNYLGTVAGRAGYAVSSNVLLYGDLGAGITNVGTWVWQAGAGAEFNMTDKVFLRAGVDRLQAFTGGPALYLGKAGIGYRF